MEGIRPIGPVDTLWLNMDRPNNLMVVDAIIFIDGMVEWERLIAAIEERMVGRYRVFRQRPVGPAKPWGLAHWEDDPDFRLERHLHRTRLRAPGGDEALRRYIERRLAQPLDHDHPLWQLHFIEGYAGGAALFARVHHAIADGFALTQVLLSLTDAAPDGERTTPPPQAPPVQPSGGETALGVAGAITRAAAGASRLARRLPTIATPRGASGAALQLWRTLQIANKLVLGHNPTTSLRGRPGLAKTVIWSRPFPLPQVKKISRLAGATVNDVFMSALAGAISDYLAGQGEPAIDLTTMVPVNLRPIDRPPPQDLGNRFALVFIRLPVGVGTPLARLAETKRRMDVIKHSPEAAITFALIATIGRTVKQIERVIVDFFAGKAIGVTTNVIGPAGTRYLAGTPISGILAWVPSSGSQTVGVCIVTYNNTVRVGFKVDTETVREPRTLLHAFDTQMETLLRMSLAAQPAGHA